MLRVAKRIGITAIVVLMIVITAYLLPPTVSLIIGGVIVGLTLSLAVFGLMTPLFIKLLVNTPGNKEPSGFHLFTYPEEGKVKIIVRGDTVIRMIMIFGGHRFARAGSRDEAKFWQIKKTRPQHDEKDEHPLADIHPFLYPWASYVYGITGAVFTGIYPLQTVHEYLIERTKIHRHEDADDKATRKKDNLLLEVVEDYSDHFRVQQFLYPFRIPAADTKDKVPLNVLAVLKARVTNPFKAAYGTNRWDIQTVNLATNAVTNYARSHSFEETLVAESPEQAKQLNIAIEGIQEDETKYGINIDGVDLIDLSPNLSDEDKSKLYAEVLAKSLGKATIIDGQSRATALKAINEANEVGGEHAIETLRTEALVRAADAAKGGTIILPMGGNTGSDPMLAAILAELKKNKPQQGDKA